MDTGRDLGSYIEFSIFIDVTNAYHFYIVHSGDYLCTMTQFQITNSKLIPGQPIRCSQHFLKLKYIRLVGNRLQGVIVNESKQYFGECDLVAPDHAIQNLFDWTASDRAIRKLFDLKTKLDFLTGSTRRPPVSFVELI
jgi:hypothetical protein